ncbi:4-coumarate--CoA ligase family protein [Carbonactinospora thermoautotrophica]|uniref:AMP-dependent synthetase n=1 Tax=Carbonactinospora thermoautotrophica TaxID=1469144 RepID=A0A132MXP3_9ACTN|nr:4-coumarate--CoA ligase family protein [Carbonactinospora thermoautotrophica]KWX02584.1 Long-chain-fatty-acid--CoA ligase [Carbonactinospora thermoautotrophica]KWX03667.1 AMP-dependent synthetase [Carbonactinospora thermoautotrophica]KWX10142.1 AMP-dependent synthetase [Carbonactinospora thermoautotrophica]MCX9190431.1 4-coumarate--CoA ligase family protein [Carbonactinospora thermoautotrophica]
MVFRSPFPDITVPDVPVHEHVLAQAAEYGDRLALVDGAGSGTRMTYTQLVQAVRRLAAGFASIGVRKGDVIAIFSPNTVAYPVVFYAATMAGATVTTVNALYTAAELADQLRDSGARYLVTISLFLDRAREATAEAPVDEILVCDTAEGCRSIQELMAIDAPAPDVEFDPAEDVAVMPYSSGTTALPKGVLLTHRNIVANMIQTNSVLHMGEGERLVAVLPFFHIYGMAVLMNHALANGATVVVLPRFELEQFLDVLAEHRITRAYVAPPIVLALAKHPIVSSYDLSSLRLVLSAAAPLDPDLAEACARRIGCKVAQGYGMTELSPVCMVVPDSDDDLPAGTVGKLIAGTEGRLVDPATGADVGVGETGELWVRGPQVMKGYLNRPDETANMIDEDGWLRTGDIARVDADGNWYIVDRVKELIKYKGYQVPPAELEAVLLTHEKIADAAVIGVLDEEGNEAPKAFVVPAAGAALTEDEVIAYVAERVAPHKKVRRVEFIDAVPKAASGKILRKELRAREARVRS